MLDFPVSVSAKDRNAPGNKVLKHLRSVGRIAAPLMMALLFLLSFQMSNLWASEFDFISAEPTKREKIKDLIQASGMEAMINQMIPKAVTRQFALVGSLRKDIPRNLLSDLADQTTLEMLASKKIFLEALVPVYDRHMTETEISTLLEIYQNPVLVGILKKIPALTHDSREVAKYWGKAISSKVFRNMSSKLMHNGYKI